MNVGNRDGGVSENEVKRMGFGWVFNIAIQIFKPLWLALGNLDNTCLSQVCLRCMKLKNDIARDVTNIRCLSK